MWCGRRTWFAQSSVFLSSEKRFKDAAVTTAFRRSDDMWTFGRKIAAGFALAFLMLAVIGAVAYRSISGLASTSQLVTHTHQVLEHIAEVLSLFKDAETGQRGYVITGDETFLEPYQTAVGSVHNVVKDLRQLTADNPNQQKRIDEAEPLIAGKLAELKQTIDLRRKGNLEDTTKVVRGGEGKKIMDNLRVILAQMEREERDLLKQRADEVEDHFRYGGLPSVCHGRRLFHYPFSQRSDWSGSPARAELIGRAPISSQSTSVRRERVGDGHERDHHDDQRAFG